MKKILYKLIGYSATNPGAGGAAGVAVADGPSLVVEHTRTTAAVVAWWGHNVATGFHQLSPESGHDPTRGNRIPVLAGESRMLLRKGKMRPVLTQEPLTVTIAGSGAAIEYGAFLMAYPDSRSGTDEFINWQQLDKHAVPGKETTIFCTLDTLAEGYSGKEGFKAESALLKPNRRYAICGMTCTVDRAALTLEGPSFGNTRIGMPGDATNPERQSEWFVDMSRSTGMPMIPTFHTGSLDNTFVGCMGRTADADTVVAIHLELLDEALEMEGQE